MHRQTLIAYLMMLLLAAVPVVAEPTPMSAPTPPSERAGQPSIERLLDDVPNYAQVLVHQWSGGIGVAARAAARDWTEYGRLRDIGKTYSLTLSDCITEALKHNTDLEVERLGPLEARAGVRAKRAIFDPVFFSGVSEDRSVRPAGSVLLGAATIEQKTLDASAGLRKTLLSGGQLSVQWQLERLKSNSIFQSLNPQYTSDLNLSLNQPLLRDFGLRYATILVRVAQVAELQAIHRYEQRVAEIVEQVEDAYWRLVRSIDNVVVQQKGVDFARELQRQNESKYQVGAVPETAVLEAKADVARRKAELIRARNGATNARDALRALLNVPSADGEALLLVDPGQRPTVEDYPVDLDRSLREAKERRPELKAARLEVKAAGLRLKVAENQLLPRLDASASLGVNGLAGTRNDAGSGFLSPTTPGPTPTPGPRTFLGGAGRSLHFLPDGRFYSYSLGITIEIPIANAQARADYGTARIALRRAHLDLRRLQQRVTLEIKSAINNLRADRMSIEANRVARELAERNVKNQQARYDVGLATTKDLLDFQDRLTAARAAEVQAVTGYATDLAALRRFEGRLLAARNVVLDVTQARGAPWWARF